MTASDDVIPTAWSVLYPRRSGDWTLAGRNEQWARFKPENQQWSQVDPADDAKLPALRAALDDGHLRGYRVERRAVVEAPDSYIKVVRPRKLPAVVANHEGLMHQSQVVVPEVLDADVDGALRISKVEGTALHRLIRTNDLDGAIIDRIASTLAAFHHITPFEGLTQRVVDERQHWIDIVHRIEPEAAKTLSVMADGLPEVQPSTAVLVHADLHDKNIIVGRDSVGVIDLDGLALGAPEDDLANLCVHLELRSLQAGHNAAEGRKAAAQLKRSYGYEASIDDERFSSIERHTWFRLACIYRYRRSSRMLCDELLRRAGSADLTR